MTRAHDLPHAPPLPSWPAFTLALLVPPLDDAPTLASAALLVCTDRTEEHIHATLTLSTGTAVPLGARAHHAALLELARARLADRAHAIPAALEGWIECNQLAARLGVEVKHLNIMIHRLRVQLAALGVVDAAAIVERRARTGLLRLGVAAVEVRSEG